MDSPAAPVLPRPLMDRLMGELYRLALAGDTAARAELARLLEGK